MTAELPSTFRLELRDAALAPELQAGDEIVLRTDLQPQAGDLVLLRDARGSFLVRELRQRLPGQFEAACPNPAFATLDLQSNGLIVVAVCVQEIRRRRRSEG